MSPWTVAYQIPLSMGFSRQKYWSGLPFPSAGDPPDPEIEPESHALAGRFFTIAAPEDQHKASKPSEKSSQRTLSLETEDLTLCVCMDCSPPGSSIRGILQARILEWVAISFSRKSSLLRD